MALRRTRVLARRAAPRHFRGDPLRSRGGILAARRAGVLQPASTRRPPAGRRERRLVLLPAARHGGPARALPALLLALLALVWVADSAAYSRGADSPAQARAGNQPWKTWKAWRRARRKPCLRYILGPRTARCAGARRVMAWLRSCCSRIAVCSERGRRLVRIGGKATGRSQDSGALLPAMEECSTGSIARRRRRPWLLWCCFFFREGNDESHVLVRAGSDRFDRSSTLDLVARHPRVFPVCIDRSYVVRTSDRSVHSFASLAVLSDESPTMRRRGGCATGCPPD